jgi:hypothetical protein
MHFAPKNKIIFLTKNILFSAIVCFLFSCSKPKNLEQVLQFAGKNRKELEKVLEHYRKNPDDSLKYKAAVFLIENMDIQFSYQSKQLETYFYHLDSICRMNGTDEPITEKQEALIKNLHLPNRNSFNIIPDCRIITAGFLIDNIDRAFDAWKSPWAMHLDFDEFCEYLLPYKVGNEIPSSWRKEFSEFIYPVVKNLLDTVTYDRKGLQQLLWTISRHYQLRLVYEPVYPGSYHPGDMLHMKKGSCPEFSTLAIYLFRSLGIPCTIDYIPQWSNRSMSHKWVAIFTEKGKVIDYGFPSYEELGKHLERKKSEVTAKVYRQTYAKIPGALAMNNPWNENLPSRFRTPRMKDVTDEYYACCNISIPMELKQKEEQNFVYLCNFNNRDWIPVDWGKIENRNAVFKNIRKDRILFLPAYYFKYRNIVPAGYPFSINKNGEISAIIPDTLHRQTVRLYRKYNMNIRFAGRPLVGATFYVSNRLEYFDRNPDRIYYKHSKLIHRIEDLPYPMFNRVDVKLDEKYRYFKYKSAMHQSGGGITEIEIYGGESGTERLTGKIIGYDDNPQHPVTFAFDGDVLTGYTTIDTHWAWAGIDFGTPQKITFFRYVPRNDDNFIREGELYELFWWNNRQWVSVGKQVGEFKGYLEYENVPVNALFWLRNRTKGKEERIFTYENGEQVWW